MAIILSIETSTSVCSVALHQEGKLLTALEVHQEYSHASKLGILVNEVTKLTDIGIDKINAVALSSGPGSYTGLRIGTSLAKGLCYALDIPLISVPTLYLMVTTISRVYPEDVFFCPMIDARRMEVYCQIYDRDLAEIEPVQAKVIDSSSFENYFDIRPVVFFGSGAAKCKPVILHRNATFLEDVNPGASQLGDLAYSKFQQGKFEDIVQFVPLYLKEFFIRKPVDV
jgi:tRNA threonylcarbamoyladenosine biosynthesis protein TsaB